MEKINWNALRDRAYKNACDQGFHDEKLSLDTYLVRIIAGICDAVEANRRGNYANMEFFNRKYKDHSDNRLGYERIIMGSIEGELAEVIVSYLDLAGIYNLNLEEKCDCAYSRHFFTNRYFSDRSFADIAFELCRETTNLRDVDTDSFSFNILYNISYILAWCEYLKIDIMKHVHLEMKYNETRPYKNGKILSYDIR